MKQFKVIEIDEDFIGEVEELKKYFLYQLRIMLGKNDISEEEKIQNVGITYDILEQLQEQYTNVVVRVAYNPMGTYYIADSLDK